MEPRSCDTFVCLPPFTKDNTVIFGKNSDRPSEEVQEVVYFPEVNYDDGDILHCTYIEIPQVKKAHAVILSKPSWMWGAEMGANSCGVCIGNEAVWGKVKPCGEKKLLGMDLLRLGLERGETALDALKVITSLLERHGQGGPCSEDDAGFVYHNSYLIADKKEAYVLETIGDNIWAAEKVSSGFRNISNELSIGTKIDLMSEGLHENAEKLKLWKKGQEFHFARTFEGRGALGCRYTDGRNLLQKLSKDKKFDLRRMMEILRDEDSGICMGGYDYGGFSSTASQVSVIPQSDGVPVHWFTGTPDPKLSIFKPFTFSETNSVKLTQLTASPQNPKDRKHPLYKMHEGNYKRISKSEEIQNSMKNLEDAAIENVESKKFNSDMYSKAVDAEISLYSK